MTDFIPVKQKLPKNGQRVDWITPSGDQLNGCYYSDNTWWTSPDCTMYVYYTPLSWRPTSE